MKPLPVIVGFIAVCAAIGIVSWMSQNSASETVADKPDPPPTSNPLEIATSGPHPKVVLEEELYNFGKMILGETDSHAFVIRNEGEAPLKLKKGRVLCKCTVPEIPGGEIPPGGSVEVMMEWEPKSTTDSFDKFAEIWTNDPENERIRLTITGEVRNLVQVQPPAPWTIPSLADDEPTEFTGAVASGRDDFEIVSIDSSAPWLQVKPRPLTEEEMEDFPDRVYAGYLLECSIQPEMPVGRFSETVTVVTNLGEDHTLEIGVNGVRPGQFSILGQAWYGREMTVTMGSVPADEGKSVTLTLFTPPEDEPLELTSVQSNPDIARVTLQRDEAFPAKAKEKYDLTFTVPPGSPVGRYSGDEKIALDLTTNRESMSQIQLNIDTVVE